MTEETKLPYELRRYIEDAQNRESEANNADFKPTTMATLEHIENECITAYNAGTALRQTITSDDDARCRKLYEHRNKGKSYEMTNLGSYRIKGTRVIVPAYIAQIEELEKLKEILA